MASPSRRLADDDARSAQLRSDLVAVQQENESLLHQRRTLFQQLNALQENYNTLQSQFSLVQNQYQSSVISNRRQVDEFERQAAEMTKRFDEQAAQLNLVKHVVVMKQSEIDSLQQQVEGLQQALNEKKHVEPLSPNNENEAMKPIPSETSSNDAYARLLQTELIEVKKTLHAAEAATRALQLEKLNWQSRQANLELVHEEKRALESKLEQANAVRDQLARLEFENKQLKQIQSKWVALTNGEEPDHFLGAVKDVKLKLAAAEETIRFLQNEIQSRNTMLENRQVIVTELNAKIASLSKDLNDARQVISKLEYLKKVSDKQVDLYKSHLKSFDDEEKMYSEKYEELKDQRIHDLEQLLDQLKNEPVCAADTNNVQNNPDKVGEILENEKKILMAEKEQLAKELIHTKSELGACASEVASLKALLSK